jgi:mono/diheme cytochrome c family protein
MRASTRMGLLRVLACMVLVGVLHRQNTAYQQDQNWHAPQDAAARTNPLAHKPEAAAGGQKLFHRNCTECHDEDGRGLAKKHAADLLLPAVQDQSDGTLFWKITNGNVDRGMPSFSKLPELQRWQLVLYLRMLKPNVAPQETGTKK